MEVGRALTFFFHDPRWVSKLAVAMLLNIVPTLLMAIAQFRGIPGLMTIPPELTTSPFWAVLTGLTTVPLFGYGLRVARNAIAGHDLPLPAWADITGVLQDGLKVWALISIWGIPAMVLQQLTGFDASNEDVRLLVFLAVPVTLLVSIVQPAAEGRLAASGSLRSGLDVGAALRLVRANKGTYVRLFLVALAGLAVGVGLGVIASLVVWPLLHLPSDRRSRIAAGFVLASLFLRPYGLIGLSYLIGKVYAQASPRTVGD